MSTTTLPSPGQSTFERERPRLLGLAYRMLGSVVEAEDVVQDAYLRWHDTDRESVERPEAFLTRIVSRLSLDALKSARKTRVDYIGPWLPEPLLEGAESGSMAGDPATAAIEADDLGVAFLLLIERLTPMERAVFILRSSYDLDYREIAGALGRREDYCRQVERRARRKLSGVESVPRATPGEHAAIVRRFVAALQGGNVAALVDLLASDVVALSDGGGQARAARKPVIGSTSVAHFLLNLAQRGGHDWSVRLVNLNGRLGLANFLERRLVSLVSLHVTGGRIEAIYSVVNPAKLPAARMGD